MSLSSRGLTREQPSIARAKFQFVVVASIFKVGSTVPASSARAVFAAEVTPKSTISAPSTASTFTIFAVFIGVPWFASVA